MFDRTKKTLFLSKFLYFVYKKYKKLQKYIDNVKINIKNKINDFLCDYGLKKRKKEDLASKIKNKINRRKK
jgi:hypothetical protein